jgi:outer membrane receptor protein involved in Fe transport
MATRKPKKDRTSFLIAAILHVVLISGVAFWAWKTGKLEVMRQAVLRYVKGDKKEQKHDAKPVQQKAAPQAKLPPINQGLPPRAGSATRRAVAADAPEAVGGGSFFQDTRTQVQKPGTSAGLAPKPKESPVATPVARPPPLRPVFAAPPKTTIKQLLEERAKAVAATEAIGAEQISRSGQSDAGGAVTKVAGAAIVEGKFAVIRGLSDRYVSTTLNGANVPSPDPYRQSAPLDLFPAQVISKITVAKTFTPDQPGAFTGGGIDIATKSFPEKEFLSFSLGGAYNSQTTCNDHFLTYRGGGLDWTGMDDGTRALPAIFDTAAPIHPPQPGALPAAAEGNISTNRPDLLLRDSLLDKLTRALGKTEFAPKPGDAPFNQNFSLAGGGSDFFLGRPLGYFASGSYKHDFAAYEDGVASRYANGTQLTSRYRDARSVSTVNWSAMANLAYAPSDDHELGFVFFYNQNSVDDARIQDEGFEQNGSGVYRKFNLYWTERNLNTCQVKGKHVLPEAAGLQFDWLVGLTQTMQYEPDARFFNDNDTGSGYDVNSNGIPSPNKPTRYFRNLEENNQNVKLDWTLPFRNWAADEGKLKFGLFDSSSRRDFSERQFYYLHGLSGSPYQNDPNLFLTDSSLGATFKTNANGRSINVRLDKYIQVFDSLYNGQNNVQAGYLMLEVSVAERLRLVGGVRHETTDYRVHSESYLASSVTSQRVNDAELARPALLPSAALTYAIHPHMNLRLSYSQTIARPSYRELAAYYSYDPVINDFIEGNPRLKMTSVDNYDLRWEWFPRPGELLSASLFYKDLRQAIERGNVDIEGETITFFNRDKASLYGVELEARKSLAFLGPGFSPFSLGGNLSLLQSEVRLTPAELRAKRGFFPNISPTRPLYDQSPYILNLDLNYDEPRAGTSASLILNVAGPRIALTKLNADDVYEQPAPTLDFLLSQKIARNLTLRLSAKNLLDPKIERTYGKNSRLLYSSYRKGLTIGLTLNYDF